MNGLINTSEGLIKGNKSRQTFLWVFDAFQRIVLMREADGKVFEVQSSSCTSHGLHTLSEQNRALNLSLHIHVAFCF